MKRKTMKLTHLAMVTLAVLVATGCTKTLSHDITADGHVEQSNLVWPELNDAWQLDGQFPNLENLSKIRPGVSKDELYQLIGRPHFSEAQHAYEWDYIMKFYQSNDTVKICQYKIIFDKEFKGQEFYWLPANCPPKAEAPVATPAAPKVIHEKITLDADALFKFDKSDLNNMLPAGRQKLDNLADKIKAYSSEGDVRLHLTGHTDYKGSEDYNLRLSNLRANTVLAYLAQKGINPATMTASGAGEDYPIKQCDANLPRQQEIDCLQPNRRVEVDVMIYKFDVK